MARTVTASQLISDARERFEIDDVAVSDAVMLRWLSGSYARLYDLMLNADPNWQLKRVTANITSGTQEYDLPADFYRMRRVDASTDGNYWIPLTRYELQDEVSSTDIFDYHRDAMQYLVSGDKVRLSPPPSWTKAAGLRFWYVPAPAEIDSTSDTIDGVAGYEEWLVLDLGIKFFVKMEWDPRDVMAQRQDVERRISDMASNRDVGQPGRIRDAYRSRVRGLYRP